MKKRVFAGMRATGQLHLGNYLGAAKGFVELQNDEDYECIYMAVDLHSTTTPFNHKTLGASTQSIILDYLSVGLDPEKVIITAQSLVPEHAYLSLLFSTSISVARMQHLPTFKEKVKQHPKSVTMALLNYPVLMAADILVYKAGLVPVGKDQLPHIEIAREIARKMNTTYGTDFPEPKDFAMPGQYVPSLKGEGKMSKSIPGSAIALTDNLETIHTLVAGIPTNSGRGESIPENGGVNSLLSLIELFMGETKRTEAEKLYLREGIRYGDLKGGLAEAIHKELKPIQERRKELEANPKYVNRVILEGAEKARALAKVTLDETLEKMGLGKTQFS